MSDIVDNYEDILRMVDDGTRASMLDNLTLESLGDPEEPPKLYDFQAALH